MKKDYDVIVIGAGPGGSAAAAILAKAGKNVLLVDKNSSAGGRMRGIHRDGYNYELFPIHGLPFNNSQFDYVLEKIGKQDDAKKVHMSQFGMNTIMYFVTTDGEMTRWDQKNGFDAKFFEALHVPMDDMAGMAKIQKLLKDMGTMPEEEIRKLENTPCTEFVDSYGEFPGMFRTFVLASFGEGAFEMTCDMVPASDMIRLFQIQARGGACRYYDGGICKAFETFANSVEENGGTVLYNTRVENIRVVNGQVTGIILKNGEEYNAPVVISTAGIRQTVNQLVGSDKFDTAYVERINSLVSGLACIGLRYFLDAEVLESPQIIYFPEGCLEPYAEFKKMAEENRKPERNYIYLGTTSLYPNCAPKGKQLVYAVMSCMADPQIDPEPYCEYIEGVLRKIQPDLFDHIERREYMTPAQTVSVGTDAVDAHIGGEAYGVANAIGQAGADRPSAISPVKGLFYAGNDAGGFGEGSHQAVDSGVKVAEYIIANM